MYSKAKMNDLIFEVLRTLLAIGISILLITGIIFLVSGKPMEALNMLFIQPFSNLRRIGNIIEASIPLMFTGIALSLTFRAKQFNLVSDGAFYAGAMVACYIGVKLNIPPIVAILLSLVGGTVVGGLLGAIPAVMKEKTGAMELVTSLMLNYVVSFVVLYVLINKVRDPNKMALESLTLNKGVALPKIIPGTRVHLGLFIALICVVIVGIFLYRTKWGYALRMTGSNQDFAHYSGISVSKVSVWAQIIGASIAGLGGAVELLGLYKTFKWNASPGYGFDGVIIATLARGNPFMVPFASLFLAYIRTGADILNRSGDVPYEIVSIVQATIILLIAANGFLKGMKQRRLERQAMEEGEV